LIFLNQAIALDSVSSMSFYLKAEAYLELNDMTNYEASLLKTVRIFPDYSKANLRLANLYEEKNDFRESEKFINHYYNTVYSLDITNERAFQLYNYKFK
jgi:Tfp pilus assembly protein PilF